VSGEAGRTLEDTVAELLRPMLRQWLETNMPRIVEKALKTELGDSAHPAKAPGSGNERS
jgi:cell pole-organizing protein PopZ